MSRYPSPIIHASRGALPVLLSVPHSGRDYETAVLANAAQGRRALETLEDPLVDRLAWRAIAAGTGAVVQPVPRAVIDCNRDETEVDPAAIAGVSPAPVGQRARHGLGLVPSRTHRHGALWRRPIDRTELYCRIDEIHRPYHQSLADGLEALRSMHGEALLLDCHSMPVRPSGQANIVIGDRHGTTSSAWVSAEAFRIVRAAGFRAALNDPYAGGAIVARHGTPRNGIHALQLEIDRSLYLESDGRTAGPGFDRIASLIEVLATKLGDALCVRGLREAAE
ncbi:N-formylglutamate amidohydrolase [Sphingomonas sp. G124]|uniref:N-formylglutamate amidohydrolase n=1 Tax=Sphingomonas cremea TaxID=2904799 RepID=A0A9X1TVT9_9SPHN|nr:N-formylglutamate amidohydrolase [Sphingomonas cremea]MCF2514539.1 N-formylglutamate amidohydrolase [Sphingomonas cremea]